MRHLQLVWLMVVLACGGGSPSPALQGTAPAGAAAPPAQAATVPALPPGPVCDARMDIPEGLHDRYLYRDDALERFGYKTKAGVIVIAPTFIDGYPFTPGGVAAVVDGTTPFVYIDVNGTVVTRGYAFDNGPDYYQEGYARIVGPDGKIGFLGETSGKIEIPPTFDEAFPFCEGKARVKVGGATYEIDRRGQRVP